MKIQQFTHRYFRIFFILLTLVILLPQALAAPKAFGADGRSKAEEFVISELEFKKTRVQDAVRIISEISGVNIMATQNAGAKEVTFFVRNLSVADIMDSMCRIAGLWYRYNKKTGIFIVMTTDEYQQDIVVYRYEPTRMFKLKYLNVGIAARTIADLFGDRVQLLGKADRFTGNDYEIENISDEPFKEAIDDGDQGSGARTATRTRTITNRNASQSKQRPSLDAGSLTPNMLDRLEEQSDEKAMEEIAQIIEDSDQQVPEVLLEMKVLEIQLTDQFQSAFDISNISGSDQTGPSDGHAVNPLNPSSSVGSSLLGLGNFNLMENPTLVFQSLSDNLRVRIQLLERDNNIKSLATPMLMAANNHPAKLFIGEETVLTTGFKAQTVNVANGTNVSVSTLPVPITEVTQIGNTLTILPSINADRSVVMRIVHENSTVAKGGGQIPVVLNDTVQNVGIDTINTSKLEGTVLAQDGMTIAVGGMIRTQTVDSEDKVPVLGDVPLLGNIFKDQVQKEVKTELVLLITPHILSAPEQGEGVTRLRMGELLEHPSDIDQYFDSLDQSRKDRVEMETWSGGAGKSPALPYGSQMEKSFVDMTKIAVKQVRQPYLLRKPEGSLTPVALKALGEVPMFNYDGVVAKPVASWSNGYHYITAIKVINLTDKIRPVDVADINGVWRAATLEGLELMPRGQEGEFTYLYVISDFSFDKIVRGETGQ